MADDIETPLGEQIDGGTEGSDFEDLTEMIMVKCPDCSITFWDTVLPIFCPGCGKGNCKQVILTV